MVEQPDGTIKSVLRRIGEVHRLAEMRHDPCFVRHIFATGEYPYREEMRTDLYEDCMVKLQCELLKCQRWIEETGQKIVVLFEGHDAAEKGGAIKRFTAHLSPRSVRVVALTTPNERQRTQWYLQRFAEHLPAVGAPPVRPLLVQPCWCRVGDGVLHFEGVLGIYAPLPAVRADADTIGHSSLQILALQSSQRLPRLLSAQLTM
jgi:hypothetical protein